LLRVTANFAENLEYNFEYMFTMIIVCLIFRIALILQFNESIGPLIKIVGKLGGDFFNFFLIYLIMTIMFTVVGNINFMNEITMFEGFFQSLLTVIDCSLGNYSFAIFSGMTSKRMIFFGETYLMLLVLIFNILLLNFIIAILSNTYNIFDNRSNGLYLSKILSTREEMNYDPSYGGFLSAMPPINLVQAPFVPIALFLKKGSKNMITLNRTIMKIQYTFFMVLFFILFFLVSVSLILPAWIVGVWDKFKIQTP